MNIFWLLLAMLLFVAFLLRVDFIFYILYVCAGVYAWSYWLTPYLLRGLQVQRAFTPRGFLGEETAVTLHITNPSRLPLAWLEVYESVPLALQTNKGVNEVVTIRGGGTAVFHYTIQGHRRGYYRLGPTRVSSGDLFGLVPEQNAYTPPQFFTVYPRLIPLRQLGLPSRLPFGTVASRQRLFEDPARPMGIRAYRSGDPMRQVNWKVSARQWSAGDGRLLVKTLEPAISLETAVLLNLHRPDYAPQNRADRLEWAIEVAASLASALANQRQAVGLLTNGLDPLQSDGEALFDAENGRLLLHPPIPGHATAPAAPIPPRNGRAHLMKLLERLARLEGNDDTPFQSWLTTACTPLSWGVTLLIITPTGHEALCRQLHQLVRQGFNPVLMVIEPDYQFGKVRQRAQQLGFTAHSLLREADFAHIQA